MAATDSERKAVSQGKSRKFGVESHGRTIGIGTRCPLVFEGELTHVL